MFNRELVPKSFIVGDLTFHAYDYRICKEGVDIGIRGQKEYQILLYLAMRAHVDPNARVPSKELFEYLYRDAERTSNSMNVFLHRVRDHLANAESIVYIETIRGKGYRLAVRSGAVAMSQAAE